MPTKQLTKDDVDRLVKVIKESDRPVSTAELIEQLRQSANGS